MAASRTDSHWFRCDAMLNRKIELMPLTALAVCTG
jgi:hypothetical protein